MKKINFVCLFIFTFLIAGSVAEASTCEFTRDLKLNDKGEDVRCLQEYLNSTDYYISLVGAGSKGKETDTFGPKTESSLILWQMANNVSPTQGYFGAKSQAKYKELTKTTQTVTTPTVNNSNENSALIANLNAQIESLKNQLSNQNQTETKKSTEEKDSIKNIKEALNMIKDAEEAIDDSKDKNEAEDILEDAKEDFYDAVVYFFENNFTKANKLAKNALEEAEEAYEEAGGETEEDEADEAIEKAISRIDKAESKIEKAEEDDDVDTDDAWDLLEEAEDLLDEAEEAFDDEDYEEAIDIANEAKETADDAIKEL